MIKLIIFDWDDVFVIGAKEGYLACYRKAMDDFNIHPQDRMLEKITRDMWGKPNHVIIKHLIGQDNIALLPDIVNNYRKYKKDKTFLGKLHYIRNGNIFLKKISQKYILAIATSQERDVLQNYIFPKFDVVVVFNTIMSSHDFEDPNLAKPNPFMLNQLLDQYQLEPNEAIMVGDAENDVRMAQKAGVEPVVVLTGHLNKVEAKKLGVTYIIDKVTNLEQVLEKLN